MSREVLGRQWDRDEVGQALRHDLGVKRMEPKRVRHPRSGYQVEVGRQVGSPVKGSNPPVAPVYDHGHYTDGSAHRIWNALGQPVAHVPVKHVYRGVSEEDYKGILERGHIASDGRGNVCADEGTCASHDPRSAAVYGGDVKNFRVLKIKVHPDDGWAVDPHDGYIKTNQPVPADRIVRATRPLTSKRGRTSK